MRVLLMSRRGLSILALSGLASIGTMRAESFELGPQVALSIPSGDSRQIADHGIYLGLTSTVVHNGLVGFGVDLVYQHWAGSAQANASTDAILSSVLGTPITGSKWSFSALQGTGHLEVAPRRISSPVMPWVRVFTGVYGAESNLDLPEQARAAGVEVISDWRPHWGYGVGLGFDWTSSSHVKLGLDAMYHSLDASGPEFRIVTVGAHASFGKFR